MYSVGWDLDALERRGRQQVLARDGRILRGPEILKAGSRALVKDPDRRRQCLMEIAPLTTTTARAISPRYSAASRHPAIAAGTHKEMNMSRSTNTSSSFRRMAAKGTRASPCILIALPALLAAHAGAQPLLFGVNANGDLYRLDPLTGAGTFIGSSGFDCNAATADRSRRILTG